MSIRKGRGTMDRYTAGGMLFLREDTLFTKGTREDFQSLILGGVCRFKFARKEWRERGMR